MVQIRAPGHAWTPHENRQSFASHAGGVLGVRFMAIDQDVASLLRVPLFAGLTPLQITEIGRRAERRVFGRGDVIVRAGAPGDGAYLILSGDAGCWEGDGPGTVFEPIDPGSLVGELAMLVEHTYRTTVVAQGWVACLNLDRAALHAQMREDPDMAKRMAQVIRERLARVAAELQVVDELLAGAAGRADGAHRRLPPPPSQPTYAGASLG
jgi:CRP-like cAMP-binding protein